MGQFFWIFSDQSSYFAWLWVHTWFNPVSSPVWVHPSAKMDSSAEAYEKVDITYYGVAPTPFLTPEEPFCTCVVREVFLPQEWEICNLFISYLIRTQLLFAPCCCSVVSDSATPWTAAHKASLSLTLSLLKLMSIELVMPSNRFIFCRPLLLLPSIFHSIRVFSNESALHIRWPKYWRFSIFASVIIFILEYLSIGDRFQLLSLGPVYLLPQYKCNYSMYSPLWLVSLT